MRKLSVCCWVNLALLLSGISSSAQSAYFQASQKVIHALDSTRLSWQIPGVDSVFISGIGMVRNTGDTTISPLVPTKYELVYSVAGDYFSREVFIKVLGERGGRDFPDKTAFIYQNTLDLATSDLSIDNFLNKIMHYFQDLGFVIEFDNNLVDESKFVIRTQFARAEGLVRSSDKKLKWVAYVVEFKKFAVSQVSLDKGIISFQKPAKLSCIIYPLIQYALPLISDEKHILPYDDENMNDYIQAALNLKKILLTLK